LPLSRALLYGGVFFKLPFRTIALSHLSQVLWHPLRAWAVHVFCSSSSSLLLPHHLGSPRCFLCRRHGRPYVFFPSSPLIPSGVHSFPFLSSLRVRASRWEILSVFVRTSVPRFPISCSVGRKYFHVLCFWLCSGHPVSNLCVSSFEGESVQVISFPVGLCQGIGVQISYLLPLRARYSGVCCSLNIR